MTGPARVATRRLQIPDLQELITGVRARSRTTLARAITLVESNRSDHRDLARQLLAELAPDTGRAVRVGISGVPGAGKSTFIDALGLRLVDSGKRVAVLAVDPSSVRTGGSILGDRTRMAALAGRDDAYIRPSPSGRHLGGVARATREALLLCEAAGFDVVIVETVGVGQSEVAVSDMVDTFLLLALARSGDQLQGIKRGILERADVIAVNKADGDNEVQARVSARELSGALRMMIPDDATGGRTRPKVLTCSALTGAGLEEVWEAVTAHRERLASSGSLEQRRAEQHLEWLWTLVDLQVCEAVRRAPAVERIRADLETRVQAGTLSAMEAAEYVLWAFESSPDALSASPPSPVHPSKGQGGEPGWA